MRSGMSGSTAMQNGRSPSKCSRAVQPAAPLRATTRTFRSPTRTRDMSQTSIRNGTMSIPSLTCAEALSPALEKRTLDRILRARDRRVVCRHCLIGTTKAAKQVGVDDMEHGILVELELLDDRQRRVGSLDLGHRDRPVDRDDRRRREQLQLVVEREDLSPVRFLGGRRVAVHGVDRRLELIIAWLIDL